MRRAGCTALIAVGLLAAAGCGNAAGVAAKGRVTLGNLPVQEGTIVFIPSAGGGQKVSAVVKDGEYAIPADAALKPGPYRVEVTWSRPTGKKVPSADPGMMTDERKEAVPAKYNTQSTLTADLNFGENTKDFSLTSN
ncbi:MAG: hypothetical protein K8U57_34325 [Planctomycetes bacterium]|nr:hypothetical protein [Planctomycetota bacterium]